MTPHRFALAPAFALTTLVTFAAIAAGQDMPMHHGSMTYVPHGGAIRPNPVITAAADTVLVGNFFFDTDGDFKTQIDTVFIEPGSSILFKLSGGSHTVTSGTG